MHVATAFLLSLFRPFCIPSLQIFFVYKQVICQAKDKDSPVGKKKKKNLRHFRIFDLFVLAGQQRNEMSVGFSFNDFRSDCGSHWNCAIFANQRMLSRGL